MKRGFPDASGIKTLPANEEMLVRSLGREDTLEKAMATHSRILVWEMPWTEPVHRVAVHRVQSIGLQSPQDLWTKQHNNNEDYFVNCKLQDICESLLPP